MTNFTNPNEFKREMDFWTLEEFKRFISVESDIKFKLLYEALYYCGLRIGELRGLTWNNIDFHKKELTINKNVVANLEGKRYVITTPKTKGSCRAIPLPQLLRKAQDNYIQFN